ncbi:unnamed protein product [Dovyalis caffra]|uniref:Cytochrome P450 n=1 Tax=Dovyalis caffra TaxID=77055 RepID=A0AAV1R0K2_9ROSI|nr:unnamed protein product [Dovyalis caffra]
MVDSNSHTICLAFARSKRPFLRTPTSKFERGYQFEKREHEQSHGIMPSILLDSKLLNEITNVINHIGAGKNFFRWKGSLARLVVTEPELIKEILNHKDGNYLKAELKPYIKKLSWDGLGTTKVYRSADKTNLLTIDDLIDECKSFCTEGQETMRNWQQKVRNEVLELFGQQNPSPEGISRLKTIWADDVRIFKPERFAEGVAKATKSNISAFLPFGMGPRNCVVMNFAYNEKKIALSMILQRYRITLSPDCVRSPLLLLGMCQQHGVQVMIQAM